MDRDGGTNDMSMGEASRGRLWVRHLLVIAVAVVAVTAGCARQSEPEAAGNGDGSSPHATASHDGHDDPGLGAPTSAPPEEKAAALAERFARAWTRRDLSAEQWWNEVSPLCTDELAEALYSTDPGTIPASKVTGSPTRIRGGQSPIYTVPTNAGTLTVTVTPRADKGWAVSDIDFKRSTE